MQIPRKMAPNPHPRLGTLLRYTYQANMVFFAGFATWYVLKGPGQKEMTKSAAQQEETEKAGRK
jgi:hypothetical protein